MNSPKLPSIYNKEKDDKTRHNEIIRKIVPLELPLPLSPARVGYIKGDPKYFSERKRSKSELPAYVRKRFKDHNSQPKNGKLDELDSRLSSSRKIVYDRRNSQRDASVNIGLWDTIHYEKGTYDVSCYVKEINSLESSKSDLAI